MLLRELRPQLGYVFRASSVMARDPAAGAARIRGKLERRRDVREFRAVGLPVDALYPVDGHWLEHLHDALGTTWPCPCEADADGLYAEIMAGFAAAGLPAYYDGWCDGGVSFTKAAWCLAFHLCPQTVVETGVARGVMSRFMLEAFARNGAGHLFSVDLPSVDSRFHDQIGFAVPERYRDRWTTRSGTSRRRLPPLLTELGEVDLFIHDSLHTGSNTLFELECVARALRPGGALLVDDVYQSLAFHRFVEAARPKLTLIGANPDRSYRFGIALMG